MSRRISKKKTVRARRVKSRPKRKPKPGFHPPFQEFQVESVDVLLKRLEKVKPEGSKIEVSSEEDTPHVVCMRPLVHGLVQDLEAVSGSGNLHILYQYCPFCKVAVRVL